LSVSLCVFRAPLTHALRDLLQDFDSGDVLRHLRKRTSQKVRGPLKLATRPCAPSCQHLCTFSLALAASGRSC
jgi:hypothetical protein